MKELEQALFDALAAGNPDIRNVFDRMMREAGKQIIMELIRIQLAVAEPKLVLGPKLVPESWPAQVPPEEAVWSVPLNIHY